MPVRIRPGASVLGLFVGVELSPRGLFLTLTSLAEDYSHWRVVKQQSCGNETGEVG